MSIWKRIREHIAELSQNNPLTQFFSRPPDQSVAFTISIIALSAKMAKADGKVTRDEVMTLRQIFKFDDRDEKDIARVFDLARKDVAGFEEYANRIHKLFAGDQNMLEDIFESLFQIAIADGVFHEGEDSFLLKVRDIFGISDRFYARLKALYAPSQEADPYHILGISPDANDDEIKAAYRTIIRENHPDQLRARGLPDEALIMAENRIRAVNEAYDRLQN